MFSEILKIIPKLEGKELAAMERQLGNRFVRIAKKFGSGLMNVFKGGGVLAIAGVLIDKLLNPLKEVEESINRTLSRGDDLATYAQQFNTSAGNLARLQAFGQATGLDPEGVRLLLGKFQGAVAQAAISPEPTAVSSFVGRKDTAEAFFEFIQGMQKLTDVQKNLVQQEVFGEKQILKSSEFLNADFGSLARKIGGPSSEQLTIAANKLGQLSDTKDIIEAQRDLADLVNKAGRINESMIAQLELGQRVQLERENERLLAFENLKRMQIGVDKIGQVLEQGYIKLLPILTRVAPDVINYILAALKGVEKSRALRGMTPGQGKDE